MFPRALLYCYNTFILCIEAWPNSIFFFHYIVFSLIQTKNNNNLPEKSRRFRTIVYIPCFEASAISSVFSIHIRNFTYVCYTPNGLFWTVLYNAYDYVLLCVLHFRNDIHACVSWKFAGITDLRSDRPIILFHGFCSHNIFYYSWLHLKLISVHIAARLRTTWALLFWPTWPAAADLTLLIDGILETRKKMWSWDLF